MALGPENAGMPRDQMERLRKDMVESHERRIDEALQRFYRPGEPFRAPVAGPEATAIAEILVSRYRLAGWQRARVEPAAATQCFIVLEV